VDSETRKRSRRGLFLFIAVWLAAGWYFARSNGGLREEPPFADEAAVLAQSRYYRLVAESRLSDPDWIAHAAYDHQPLYKYLVGFALHVTGQYEAIPDSLDEFDRWMNGGVRPPANDGRLSAARWAMVVGSSLSVALVFAFVRRLRGTIPGLLAAVLFASSPLVLTHARRAMIDLTAVGLCVGSLQAACQFAQSHRTLRTGITSWALFVLVGALAPLAKWNAALGCVAAAVVGMTTALVGPRGARQTGLCLAIGAVAAAALFVALDPFYWSKPDSQALSSRLQTIDPRSAAKSRFLAQAGPWERAKHALEYRRQSMATAKQMFPKDYLSPAERPTAILVEGIGRWSLGNRPYTVEEAERSRPERRRPRDWINLAILGPLAFIGFVSAVRSGWTERSEGRFPIHWLLVVWIALDIALLLGNLTVDWDRYYLSVVAWSSIAAAVGVSALIRAAVGQLRLKPRELTPL
jgi:hypothetical protein